MPKIPILTAFKVIRTLKKCGFEEERQKGSHLILIHPQTLHSVTVPIHSGKDIKRGTLKSILEQANITLEKFIKNL